MFLKEYKLCVPSSDEKKALITIRISGFTDPNHFTVSANSERILILDVVEDHIEIRADVRMKGAETLPMGIVDILRSQAEKNLCRKAA